MKAAVQVVWRTASSEFPVGGVQRTSGQITGQRLVSAAAVTGLPKLSGGSQPKAEFQLRPISRGLGGNGLDELLRSSWLECLASKDLNSLAQQFEGSKEKAHQDLDGLLNFPSTLLRKRKMWRNVK